MDISMKDKKVKVNFAPGAFDNFEGTQEELDELLADIEKMFSEKTAEEIRAMSHPLTENDFDELPEEIKEIITQSLLDDEEPDNKRTLQ